MTMRRMGAGRLPVALTAVAAIAGTALAGRTAHAAPTPDPRIGEAAQSAQDAVSGLRDGKVLRTKAQATDELNFGDLDGDDHADLAAVDPAGRLWVYPGLETVYSGTGPRPTTSFEPRFQAGTGWSKFTALVRHGDWNNDGRQDILARDSQGRLFLYPGTGARPGIVRNGVQIGTGWNAYLDIVGVGDTDGDGFDDLMGRRNGYLVIYYGTGNGDAPFRRTTSSGGSGWNGSLLTTIGDWNGDGRTEFMFRNPRDEVLLYWGSSSGFPAKRPELIFAGDAGVYVEDLVGMGNLTSDAVVDGAPVAQPLPDVVLTDTDGYLYAVAPDTGDDFDPVVGFGWRGYRLF